MSQETLYPHALLDFIDKVLVGGLQKNAQARCSRGGDLVDEKRNMTEMYYVELINTLRDVKFENQSAYEKVKDLSLDNQRLCIGCLGHQLGLYCIRENVLLEITEDLNILGN